MVFVARKCSMMPQFENHVDLAGAERLVKTTGFAPYVAIASWVFISIWAFFIRSPDGFSRAGAVGSLLVLLAFAIVSSAKQSYTAQLMAATIAAIRVRFALTLLPVMSTQNLNALPGSGPGGPSVTIAKLAKESDQVLDATAGHFIYLDHRSLLPRSVEVACSIIATAQWGYGDCLMNMTLICGKWKC